METDRRDEIAASVAAGQALGPGYEEALAEGLVERISAEIDDRIAAQIDGRVSAEVDGRVAAQLEEYVGCRHVRRARRRAARSNRPSVLLALGSMVVAAVASAIVLIPGSQQATSNGTIRTGPGSGALVLTAVIWIVIAVVNMAYAQRQQQ
jgi:hypothetical protein